MAFELLAFRILKIEWRSGRVGEQRIFQAG